MAVRKRGYRKHFKNLDLYIQESEILFPKILTLQTQFNQNLISAPEFVASFILTYIQHREPRKWMGAQISEPKSSSPIDICTSYILKNVPMACTKALRAWRDGQVQLILLDRIPSPQEVLEFQIEGRRIVSVLTSKSELAGIVHDGHDALSLCLHDLIHAEKFLLRKEISDGQLGFYKLLLKDLRAGRLNDYLKPESPVNHELQYILSDMNSHAVHLMKCFKSTHRAYHLSKNGISARTQGSETIESQIRHDWDEFSLRWGADSESRQALDRLNSPHFMATRDGVTIHEFLKSKTSVELDQT